MITVTESAISQMTYICTKNGSTAVRYELKGGGCGGLMSNWEDETEDKPSPGDLTWPLGEDKVFVVDEFTSSFIEGGVVDYDMSAFMPQFKVSVPGKGSCGCGESFVA